MPGKGELPTAPPPVTAENAAFLYPPPSYEETMGVYQTSVNQQVPYVPALSYMDIMPRCLHPGNIKERILPKFNGFDAIIEGANRWLQDNRSILIWKCETVQRKVGLDARGNLTYDLDKMIRHDSAYGFQVFIRGLRLWLTKNPLWSAESTQPQQLSVRNVVPDKVQVEIPMGGYYRRRGILVGPDMLMMYGGLYAHQFSTFEGLEKTVDKINVNLKAKPLPGKILSLETDSIKAYEGFKSELDPDSTCWSEEKLKFRRMTQVIRIYYIHGQSANEQIGFKEFIPELVARGDALKPPKFEPMSRVMAALAEWVPQQQASRIVNLQQFDAKIHTSLGNVDIASDSTDETINLFGENRMAHTIRCFYVRSATEPAPKVTRTVTSRLFLPCRIPGNKTFENMNQTMDRLDAWLRVTGMSVYSVETVQLVYDGYKPDCADLERADYTLATGSGAYWLTGIRVYFPAVFDEPDPALLPPKPDCGPQKTSSCSIL